MIKSIELKNFKCFDHVSLPLRSLTLLSGTNASGKSTLLQSLIILHQTVVDNEWSNRLLMNGSLINLGSVSDVVNKLHGRKVIEISIEDEKNLYLWSFEGEREDLSMAINHILVNDKKYDSPKNLRYFLPEDIDIDSIVTQSLMNLTYISAERVGPREFYPLADKNSVLVVGPAGEYSASVLYWKREMDTLEELKIEKVQDTIQRQVEARMKRFFPGFVMKLDPIPQTNSFTLGIRTSDATDFHRPINVGFGVTQTFPIIVASLTANKGDILLIENPEVHLHPAGQSLMGLFLAEVAAAGIQIILETHSDHILNGIRKAVKNNMINHKDVSLYYFENDTNAEINISNPQIDKKGNIDFWPSGFFDQYDKDIDHFVDWG